MAAVKQHGEVIWVGEKCQTQGTAERTFTRWKKRCAELEPDEVPELKRLCEENSKLKRWVADLSLDETMLQDLAARKWSACRNAELRHVIYSRFSWSASAGPVTWCVWVRTRSGMCAVVQTRPR